MEESSQLLSSEENQPVAGSSTSSTSNAPRNRRVEDNHIETPLVLSQSRYASHVVSLIDMVWTGLEVFLILLGILSSNSSPWYIALICIAPNIIQFSGAILMYKKTKQEMDLVCLYHSCQIWLFLAFVTIVLHGVFITWTTVTGIITTFLIFLQVIKLLWRRLEDDASQGGTSNPQNLHVNE